jgi:hypothetical protein
MANAFEHHISHEQEQMWDGPTKPARAAARPFPGRDSVSAGAFTIPARSAEQKRLAGEVAWSVAERTAELAETNDRTRREIGERRKLKSNLRRTKRPNIQVCHPQQTEPRLDSQAPSNFPNEC